MEKLSELCSIFPKPESILESDSSSLEEAVKNGNIVLDTNTLLVPYGVSSKSLDEIKRVLNLIASQKRLFIPAHVIREFAIERVKKIAEIFQYVSQIKSKQLSINKYPLLSKEVEFQKIHELQDKIDKLQKEIGECSTPLVEKIKGYNRNDPVSATYREIFSKEIIRSPKVSKKDFEDDLKRRNEYKIPPGYKDHAKEVNAGGDLIIWHTILEIGRTDKKDLVFVTQETKPDWFHNSGKQPFQPRIELVDEYKQSSGGKTFHIVPFLVLLSFFEADKTTLKDISIQVKGQKDQKRANQVKTSKSIDDQIDSMLSWFYENYERPENSLPYEGKEGGFFYIWGGPYDAKDVLWDQFGGGVSEKVIDLCVEKIEEEHGYIEWSKINQGEPTLWVNIYPDWETGERCGASGTFQVTSIEDEDGKDFTKFIDQGVHYHSEKEVLRDLSKALGCKVDGELQD